MFRMKQFSGSAGHAGGIFLGKKNSLLKEFQTDHELNFLQKIHDSEDSMKSFVPYLHGVTEIDGRKFLELENLVEGVENACVMDTKIGSRTFILCSNNHTKRHDLYEKMIKLCPDEPTAEEREEEKITKHRYMNFRDRYSTIQSFGFRIDGLQYPGGKIEKKKLQSISTLEEIEEMLKLYLKDQSDLEEAKTQICNQISDILAAYENSEIFQSHDMVGSSLLFIVGSNQIKVKAIDFAKCRKLEENCEKSDGYEDGIKNLKKIFSSL